MSAKRRLSGYVLAHGPEGTVLLSPDDPLPDWAEEAITNPKAWADGQAATPAPEGDGLDDDEDGEPGEPDESDKDGEGGEGEPDKDGEDEPEKPAPAKKAAASRRPKA